ncbi:cobaltochelatase subunit CobN [Methanohalophilus mahii]|nr:cobaltochelatase subunit CobN [Methanohalophilus mahii]
MLAVAVPAVSASENMMKINNVTSDENGNFVLDDIPFGEYELYAANYSESRGEWKWYKGKIDVEVNGSDLTNQSLEISSSSMIDENWINSYIDGYNISGRTYSTGMGNEYNKSSNVVLLTRESSNFVLSTTSDENGNFVLDDIPFGEYELYAANYSESRGEWKWYKGKIDVEVNGSDLTNQSLEISSSSMIDENWINSYIDGYNISGRTYSTGMGNEYNKSSNVVLLTRESSNFVLSTTSDENGNFVLDDIPFGEYELYAANYSESRGEWKWYKGKIDVEVNGSDLTNQSLEISSSSMIDENWINSYIDGYNISGRTYSTGMGNEYNKSSNVVLLKSLATSSSYPLVNVSIITGYSSYEPQLESLVGRINNDSTLNLSVSYHLPSTIDDETDLSNVDVIYAKMFTDSASKIENEVDSAISNGTIVITDNAALTENIPAEFLDDRDEIIEILEAYWKYGATEESNFDNMIYYLAKTFVDRNDLDVKAPDGSPKAIYHPNMTEKSNFTSNSTEYFDWYRNREDGHAFDENSPTVGLTFYSSYYPERMGPFDSLIAELESRNMNVIACYGSSSDYVDPFFNHTPETKVDLILSSTYRSQYFDIENLGVPVMNTVTNGYMNLTEWKETSSPLPNTYMIRLYRPETWGWIDPIMIASTEFDSQGNKIYEPVDTQVEWLVDRAEAQTNLSAKDHSDKKVVVLYYNHGAGKNNIGASYLEVVPSIGNLLGAMANESYDVQSSSIPNKTELVDLFVKQGTNIGTWAPGELEDLVETNKVELIPEHTYRKWFDTLPEERRKEVTDRWGEAPGEIMVYEDDSGDRFVVIPKIEISDNVILAPQPTRGWFDDLDALYHDADLPPHHQYIAFYLWLQNDFDADVMVNMGRHGTVEWLPGKEFGLFSEEWPALMVGDIPVVYPYVMDGMGEGMQAKRRGSAVVIDHLIPPVVMSGSYGNYTDLNEKISQYHALDSDPDTQETRFEEIVNLTYELHLDERINMTYAEAEDEDLRDHFLDELDDVLRELRTTSMPYGLHILGKAPKGEQLSEMVCSMLGKDFKDEVAQYNTSEKAPVLLLDLVLNQNTSSTDAQLQILGEGNNSDTMDNYLSKATEYSDKLSLTEDELQQLLKAMDGKYVEPNLGGDPIQRSDALPSGRNFYAFDEQLIPTKQSWELGKKMANETMDAYQEKHGDDAYPSKAAFILWAGESTRHEGVMEAEILYLLGVRPVWGSGDKVEDVELIPSSELDRPRIDVLVQISGLYRDSFPHKVELIDKAVYLAYNAPDNGYDGTKDEERPAAEYISYDSADNTNYVRENTNNIYDGLNATLQNETASMNIALLRIFGPADGSYGTGMSNAVSASDTWENNTELADLYMDRMSNAYGEYVWGESMEEIASQWDVADDSIDNKDVFNDNLEDVGAIVHSRSSNTYGAMDTDDFFQYFGGLNLVVSEASGMAPETYVMNLQNPDAEKIETLSTYLSREIVTRYLNPTWFEGMQQHGFEGAGKMGNFIENLWGWEALHPDLIADHVWNDVYDAYFTGENREWIKETNPYEYQSMNARMLETARKNGWDASDEQLKSLVSEFVESIAETGDVTCCHHTCGNPALQDYVDGYLSMPGVVDEETAQKYREIMDEATTSSESSSTSSTSFSSGGVGSAQIVNTSSTGTASNQTTSSSDGGYSESAQDPTPDSTESSSDYVEGYEMTKENPRNDNSGGSSFSGADIVGTVLVLAAVGAMYIGFRRRQM